MQMMASVNRTFLRRSAIRKMFAKLDSMGALRRLSVGRCYRLVRALPLAGGRPLPNGGGTTVTEPPAPVTAASAAVHPWRNGGAPTLPEPRARVMAASADFEKA